LTAIVPPDTPIRPMTTQDVAAADAVARAVLFGPHPGESEEERQRRAHMRIRHLCESDPGGAWVAERDGEVVGVAMALLREGIWGLSLFAVAEAHQGRGVGRELLDAAYAYGDGGARGHLILSTERPAAMRRYARLGLELRPAVAASGIVRPDARLDADGVVEAGAEGIAVADAIGREVRGAGHGPDLPATLESGARLFLLEDRAFGVLRPPGGVMLIAGRDDEAAARVLRALFAAAGPGATVSVDFLTAGQDWAVRTCLDAGLALSPDGPLFAGGELGPLRPYVPSGAYL
jgi:GNAT superfamily N-acetyltransferase